MSDRDWQIVLGRVVIYRYGWRWTVMWRSGPSPYRWHRVLDMNGGR